jgi:DNA invertase Pin-like site-specific DNA recombinase
VLDFIGKGDVLRVTRVDRLARSIGDLQDIVRMLKTKGASLRATEQPIDTSTAAGKCFLDMLDVFAKFETTSVASVSSRALPRLKQPASIRAAPLRSTQSRCAN